MISFNEWMKVQEEANPKKDDKARGRAQTHADADVEGYRAREREDYNDTEYAAKQSSGFPKYRVKQNMKKK